jgi:hypothetical protein
MLSRVTAHRAGGKRTGALQVCSDGRQGFSRPGLRLSISAGFDLPLEQRFRRFVVRDLRLDICAVESRA